MNKERKTYILIDGKTDEEVLSYLRGIGCTESDEMLLRVIDNVRRRNRSEPAGITIYNVNNVSYGSKEYFDSEGYIEVKMTMSTSQYIKVKGLTLEQVSKAISDAGIKVNARDLKTYYDLAIRKDNGTVDIGEGGRLGWSIDPNWNVANNHEEILSTNNKLVDAYSPKQFDLVIFKDKFSNNTRLGWIIFDGNKPYVKYATENNHEVFSYITVVSAKRHTNNPIGACLNNIIDNKYFEQVYPIINKIRINDDYSAEVYDDRIIVGCTTISREKCEEIMSAMNLL